MLVKPPMEKLLPKVENRYVLAILVAKRARQLVNGAQPLSQSDSPNLVTVACEELGADKIACVKGHVNPYIPLRPEIEAARLAAQAAAEQASTADAIREELDKVASRPAPDADDAALIGEALM
ncbi:MAG: DNA-directed RNA polymerase subunit omega, partial [Clostridiaceae bacterium]|nr:DNA-directed RNA polymerase subunit omega [Clostridiaceae bacterium]